MTKPEELEELANRIDHEELWRMAGMDHDKLSSEQKDRLWAGVNLRRYAMDRGTMLEELKEGAQYMRGMRWSAPIAAPSREAVVIMHGMVPAIPRATAYTQKLRQDNHSNGRD